MIKNIGTNGITSLLDAIMNSPHAYYMTGSRYFGNSTPTSDYDFFVEFSQSVIAELGKYAESVNTNRVQLAQAIYDSSVVGLITGEINGCAIHVQLINHTFMARKIAVNEFLKQHPRLLVSYNKAERSKLWTDLMKLIPC